MKRRFLWAIEGEYLGTSLRGDPPRFGPPSTVPLAEHYLCPACGREWAYTVPVDEQPCRHRFNACPCPTCGVTGSLNLRREEIVQAPQGVLEYETLRAAEHPKEWLGISPLYKKETGIRAL